MQPKGGIMKFLTRITTCTLACVMLGPVSAVYAQDLPNKVPISKPPFPVSDEAIDLAAYPLKRDSVTGLSTARLGEGKIFQLDVNLVEIPPGGEAPPSRHMSEEYVYIVSGEGYTEMWVRAGERPQRYQWSAGDLLSPSLNAWHQHFNASAEAPARYLSLTTAPLSANLYHDAGYLTSSDYVFEERWRQGISQQPEQKSPDNMDMRTGHHVPDLPGRPLPKVGGRWGMNLRPDEGDMAGNRLLEAFVREYRSNDAGIPSDGDRHPWEKVYLGLEGEGHAILKPEHGPAKVVLWKKGQVFFVEGYEHHDIGPAIGAEPTAPYPRIMQMKAPGYFDGVGNTGETERTYVTGDDRIIVEEADH